LYLFSYQANVISLQLKYSHDVWDNFIGGENQLTQEEHNDFA